MANFHVYDKLNIPNYGKVLRRLTETAINTTTREEAARLYVEANPDWDVAQPLFPIQNSEVRKIIVGVTKTFTATDAGPGDA